jgi:drug/metabolite transporter (DMT)-like permease
VTVSLVVLALLGAAAVLHTTWNVLLKTSEDPLATATRAVSWGLLVATAFLGVVWLAAGTPLPSSRAIVLAVASGGVELFYFWFLSAAYERGDLSTVYPIARGTAPLLSVASGMVLLGERLQPLALAGVGLVLAGIWLARAPAGSGPAVRFAVLTGVTIAAYSTIDRVGVLAAPPWLYAWMLWVVTAVVLWLALAVRRRSARAAARAPTGNQPTYGAIGDLRATVGRDLVLGVAMLGAWLLILQALSLAPLAAVGPLREGAIVLTAGWGVLRLRERARAGLRLTGAAAITLGVMLVAVA